MVNIEQAYFYGATIIEINFNKRRYDYDFEEIG